LGQFTPPSYNFFLTPQENSNSLPDSIAKKGNNTLTLEAADLTSDEECIRLWDKGIGYYDVEKYRQAYDTLRTYVESCYNTTSHFFVGVFSDIGAAAQYMDPAQFDPGNMVDAREWFKKVLYYREDTSYYCADVSAMMLTTTYWEGRGHDYNASLAVIKYILDSNRCPGFFTDVNWKKAREAQYKQWRDTVKDSLLTPLDTTLPSLEEIGMDILRGKPARVLPGTSFAENRLASIAASPNPFKEEVVLKVELNASTLVRLDVYDELGRLMYGEGQGYKLKGEHRYTLDGKAWSGGVYYARISASNGEVLTVKLIKE